MIINEELAKQLIIEQFPSLSELPITPVTNSGWDNRTFHLGDKLSIRLPSSEKYEPQIRKEFEWLPKLAEKLDFTITTPVELGKPSSVYPWYWSINRWIEGEALSNVDIKDKQNIASDLGRFLQGFQGIETNGGPIAGAHNFHRGGSLSVYNDEMTKSLPCLKNDKQQAIVQQIWRRAISTTWKNEPVWVHGDLATGNILVLNGDLKAVIDFGQLAIGDPACDLVISWNYFDQSCRSIFRSYLKLDDDTRVRAMGWALWKTICWPIQGTDQNKIIEVICQDYTNNFI